MALVGMVVNIIIKGIRYLSTPVEEGLIGDVRMGDARFGVLMDLRGTFAPFCSWWPYNHKHWRCKSNFSDFCLTVTIFYKPKLHWSCQLYGTLQV